MIIKMLMENTTNNCALQPEHGLSIYIEVGSHKILFDAGQSNTFISNAEKMGVELADVDTAILSHGHYDHGGGMPCFLEKNNKANLYINEHAFDEFYSGTTKYIGIKELLRIHEKTILTSDYYKLDEGIELYTCNTLERKFNSDSNNLYVKHVNSNSENVEINMKDSIENLTEDTFCHEQYLLITEADKKILISGCSHKGILNIVEWFQPDVLIGGFHFKGIPMNDEGKVKLNHYAEEMMKYATKYYTCHCTGVEQYEYLKEQMGEQVEYLGTGDVLEIKI